MKIYFIADFFLEDILGGGELHNDILIEFLSAQGHDVIKLKSTLVTDEIFSQDKGDLYIVANFINLLQRHKKLLAGHKYIIYEHDHKYLRTRNPAMYEHFKAPKDQIINLDFYKSAALILCQSDFHASIVKNNIGLENILSVGGNLWSEETLDLLEQLAIQKKQEKFSVMNSNILHKGTAQSVAYCKHKGWEYQLIGFKKYHDFLKALAQNQNFVFFPQTPETLSRVIVEARMMNIRIITNGLAGATKEPWYSLKGKQLIDVMRNKKFEILDIIEKTYNEDFTSNK